MRRFIPWLVAVIATAAPVVARAQVSLTEVNAATAISQDMQGRNAGAATGAGQPAATADAAESIGMGGVKYIPAYAIVFMLVGLSTLIVCRPSRRHDD